MSDEQEVGGGSVDLEVKNDLSTFPGREYVVGDDPPEGYKLPVTGAKEVAFTNRGN